MKHPFWILLLLFSLALSAPFRVFAANDGPDNVTVLVDEIRQNGGFESGLRPWTSRKGRDMREHSADAVAAPVGEVGPVQGERMLVLRTVNEDMKRSGVSAGLSLKKMDLAQGRKFRMRWQARSRAAGEFDRTQGSIRLRMSDGSTVTVGNYTRSVGTEWSEHVLEGVYTGEAEPVSGSVSLGFLRNTTGGPLECEGYLDAVRLEQMPASPDELVVSDRTVAVAPVGDAPRAPIPVTFQLDRAAEVTLVIEDESGKRVRNLVSGESFAAGKHTVWWDGLDEGVPAPVAGSQSQRIERSPVAEGVYRVRGLMRDPLRLIYDFTALPNVGNPPWPTEMSDGKGGWLADHGTPAGVGYIPAALAPDGVEQMLLTSTVGEAAQAVAWVDLQGNKLAGRRTLGGTWTGASHVAPDRGTKRNPEVYLYTHTAWRNKEGREIRLMALTAAGSLTAGKITHPFFEGEGPEGSTNPVEQGIEGAMAVHDGMIVYSLHGPDRLYFLDASGLSPAQQSRPLGEAEVEKPRGLAFERDGALLVLSDKRVLRYRIGAFPNPLSEPEVVVAEGLEEPRSLSVDDAGNLYIGDWGQSHQVKVFNREGRLVRAMGKPGAPRSGAFDEEKMNYPFGVAVTPSGEVWVTMRPWRTPKTVAVWKTDGTFVRGFYGPSAYGGGGFLDPANPDRLLYSESTQGGVEFKLDRKTGRADPARVYWLSADTPAFQPKTWQGPMFPRRIDGQAYITNEFGGPTNGAAFLTIWKDNPPQGISPATFVGKAVDWPQIEALVAERFPEIESAKMPARRFRLAQTLVVAWTDANGDGLQQEDELKFRSLVDEPGIGLISSTALAGDNFTVLITHGSGVLELKPRRVEAGVPYYDLADLRPAATELRYDTVRSSGRSQVLRADDGTMIVTGGPIMGVKDGEVKWTYHSQWHSLHIGHAAPRLPEYPGQLLATTRLLGPLVKPGEGEAGELWAINSDRGVSYLFTSDGLFVDTLFTYPGEGEGLRWNMPESRRGMELTNVNSIGEHFFPSINQQPGGEIYLVAGKSHSSLVRIEGLNTIRRFEAGSVKIDAAAVNAIRAHGEALARWERDRQGGGPARIATVEQSIRIDGKLDDWPALHWLPVGKGRITRGFSASDVVWSSVALSVDREHLYVAVRTRQNNLLGNSGADPQLLFTTGGGLDLQLSTRPVPKDAGKEPQPGDVRVLLSLVKGKPLAMRYRPKVAGATDPVIYESPIGRTEIDRVDDVSGNVSIAATQVKLSKLQGGLMGEGDFEQIEVAIPLTVLDWNPVALPVTRGDVGVLLGRPGATLERVYWHNLATGLVSDVPSEAKLQPHLWGEFRVQTP